MSSRAAPPQAESTPRPARRTSHRRAAPPRVPARPQVVQEVDEAALMRATRRCWSLLFLRRRRGTAPLLPPEEGREENPTFFLFLFPTFSKKKQFPFPPGSQVYRTTVCDTLLPHSHPRPIFPAAKRVRFGDAVPPHTPLASLVWDPGSSVRMPQNAPPSYHPALLPFTAPQQVRRLRHWRRLHGVWSRGSRCPVCLAGSRAQIDSATRFSSPGDPPKFNGVLETSVFTSSYQERWSPTNPGSVSLEPGFAQAPVQDADAEVH